METRRARAGPVGPWAEAEPFPPAGPPSLTDAAAIRAYEWDAARELAALSDTRRVSEPTASFVAYHWAVTFHGDYGLVELVRRVQAELAAAVGHAALQPVDTERVCVPLARVADTAGAGGAGELDARVLAELEWAGRQACADATPLRLAVGPVTLGPGSVRLSVTPWDGLLGLHHGLRVATRGVLGPRPWLRELTPYRPHVSLAHARGPVPVAALLPGLERLRGLPPVRVRVRRASLVRVTRLGPGTTWHDLASAPLGPVRSF